MLYTIGHTDGDGNGALGTEKRHNDTSPLHLGISKVRRGVVVLGKPSEGVETIPPKDGHTLVGGAESIADRDT